MEESPQPRFVTPRDIVYAGLGTIVLLGVFAILRHVNQPDAVERLVEALDQGNIITHSGNGSQWTDNNGVFASVVSEGEMHLDRLVAELDDRDKSLDQFWTLDAAIWLASTGRDRDTLNVLGSHGRLMSDTAREQIATSWRNWQANGKPRVVASDGSKMPDVKNYPRIDQVFTNK